MRSGVNSPKLCFDELTSGITALPGTGFSVGESDRAPGKNDIGRPCVIW